MIINYPTPKLVKAQVVANRLHVTFASGKSLLERSKAKNLSKTTGAKPQRIQYLLVHGEKEIEQGYITVYRMMMDFGQTVSHMYNKCCMVFEP